MGAIEMLPSLKDDPPMEEARFLRFLEARSEDERWELIDGEPIQMMHPPSLKHQVIGQNLERRLNDALEAKGSKLFAIREIGLAVEGHPNFRPQADVAVIDDIGANPYFAERFHLVAEVLSDSNTHEYIHTKRLRYADHPDCLHILILSQTDMAVEVWSRSDDWRGRIFRSPDDRIELPEFGFSCAVGDLYARTSIR
ncbi:Uma2 family endonuclease [Aurantimonas sp. C2-6-R+9]|uniref:Uma2 family endonuclease n=1 Tax=unclassified Aurantimonas TaxID=2638230 RepID=UPI002E19C792|nr:MULTISPECIES: Uma2 family endonuclease [unclassified Aurantimonas]MEC5291077.1 Uma2 family endonuclease [Aurantimonas sp. C2-3-R2]MEC5381405.1 Uma2 family endonuclease [Aurantimonas sp. C2-6-R+9]MEC5412228.1 Uma2 family endonuclease [Aurantimonas sp. C2-4-R8]